MKAALLLVALVAAVGLASAASVKTVPDYQQCGGLGGMCTQADNCDDAQWADTKCESGSKCERNTEDHWMCKPGSSEGSSDGLGSSKEDEEEVIAKLLEKPWTGDKKKLPKYQQCGGKGGNCDDKGGVCADVEWPGYECEKGSVCTRNSDYSWQCKPEGEGKATALTDENGQPTTDVSDEGVIPRWKQCGGATGQCSEFGLCKDCRFPGTSCEKDYVCSRVVEHFWQCMPEDMASPGPSCKTDKDPFVGKKKDSSTSSTKIFDDSKCGEKANGMEIDGTYLDSVALVSDLPFHECCDACAGTKTCMAFQVNEYGNNGTTCDFFSKVDGMVEASGSVAAMLIGDDDISSSSSSSGDKKKAEKKEDGSSNIKDEAMEVINMLTTAGRR